MKNRYLFATLISLFSISGCSITLKSTAEVNYIDKNYISPVVFSELLIGGDTNDRALEISNISSNKIDLFDYSISIYKGTEKTPYIKLDLSNYSIDEHTSFVICYDKANDEIKTKSNYITDKLMVDGTWPISLNYKGKVVDVLGNIGYRINYAKGMDLVRKTEFLTNRRELDDYDWIRYRSSDFSHLGNYELDITNEELLEGPKLTEEMRSLPFIQENGNGGGGFVEVDLAYTGDGDTTNFYFPSALSKYDISSRESVRYLRINTPEIQHGSSIDAQPWGEEAKRYNNQVLIKAKHFIIQTEKDNAIRETYGRMLAYVWYSNEENPALSDYRCLNLEMLRVGLATIYFSNDATYINPLLYKGISYSSLFYNAETYAKKLGLKVHGEKDPNFNY